MNSRSVPVKAKATGSQKSAVSGLNVDSDTAHIVREANYEL
jgi:hypothetical protein